MNMWIKEKSRIGTTIDTMAGKCDYWCTETEDKDGCWSQDWNVRDGFYVIHEGPKHYVYKLRGNIPNLF